MLTEQLHRALNRTAVRMRAQAGAAGPVSPLGCFRALDHRDVFCVEAALPGAVRGSTLMLPEIWMVMLSDADGRCRQRFTLAHELGHALLLLAGHMHAPTICEALCDAFAAELLMPRAELAGVRDAGWIAGRYDVSLAAAQRRVGELRVAVPAHGRMCVSEEGTG